LAGGITAAPCVYRAIRPTPRCRSWSPEPPLKEYGLIVADNGSDWFVSGAPHPRWDNDQLRHLRTLQGSDFEVVRVGVRSDT
jgi:hypothetical protein